MDLLKNPFSKSYLIQSSLNQWPSACPIFKGFKVAYIVFKNESSLQKALQLDSTEMRYFSTEDKPIETGINSKVFG